MCGLFFFYFTVTFPPSDLFFMVIFSLFSYDLLCPIFSLTFYLTFFFVNYFIFPTSDVTQIGSGKAK